MQHPATLVRGRLVAWAAVVTVCLHWLYQLRTERLPVANLNDGAVHTQMIRFAGRQIADGNWPFASWYPLFQLGSPYLQHYQSGPAVLTALVGRVVGDDIAYSWSLWLLVSLWPIAVYAAARLFGCDRLTSVAASVIAPVLVSASGYGYEHASYTWQGSGLWASAVGMWLLPLSWALTWRAVVGRRSLVLGAAALGAVVSLHFLTGYQAILAVGIWVLIAGRRGVVRRGARAVLLGVVGVCASAWAIVPLVVDTEYTAQSIYMVSSFFNDSYGARQILTWLVMGEVYDAGRVPVVTALVLAGAISCAVQWRSSARARAFLSIWVFSLMLWFGRATWGPLVGVFPGSDELLFHRFVTGVHLSGVLLAGTGIGVLARLMLRLVTRVAASAGRWPGQVALQPALALSAGVVLLSLQPAYAQISAYDRLGNAYIETQRAVARTDGADVDRLIAATGRGGEGRVYAGSRNNWGKNYRVGQVPVYALLADADVDAVGFTLRAPSLSSDVEVSFNPSDVAQLRLLGIRYLIYPDDQPAPEEAVLLRAAGRHRLYEVPGVDGLITVGDIVGTVTADRATVQPQTAPVVRARQYVEGQYVAVAFSDDPVLPPTTSAAQSSLPGTVDAQVGRGEAGRYSASVALDRQAAVILRASYDGRWTAFVDGEQVQVGMVAPSFVGAVVPAGRHGVEFVYVPYDQHELWMGLGLLALAGLYAAERRGLAP